MRLKIAPFFTNLKIKQFLPVMLRKTDELIRLMEDTPNPLNVKEVLDRYTIDLIGLYTSSVDLETMKNKDSELERQLGNFFNKSIVDTLFRFLITIPKVVRYLKIMTFNKEVTKFFMLLLDDIVHARNRSKLETTVVLDVLTQKTFNGGEYFTRSEIVGNLATLLLAGYETTSNALTFGLYELAYNMELQEKLRIETSTLETSLEPFSLLDKFKL
ncbi:cytochrome P450 6a2-like [Photinus pyralis]|uniref:cytochrome P450 6a2-like n=1 Tax=Photinus pyralis TaxID=7054 RepID=UPI0012676CBB|nr:cytochrome P450 6a2-like [Photinus pyralis]